MKNKLFLLFIIQLLFSCSISEESSTNDSASDWQPAENPLFTKWGEDISPENVHQEYPRPTMVRERWQNLNGLWNYTVTKGQAAIPETFEGEILVPFPIESSLSGVKRMVQPDETLWYQHAFSVPENWEDDRLLLHFGAVDWHARVYLNGKMLKEHKGGYDSFSVDLTEAIGQQDVQTLTVEVKDPTDSGPYPRGKQTLNPKGIWYTPTTGIWRTVWLEPVPNQYLTRLKLTPDIDNNRLLVAPLLNANASDLTIEAVAFYDGKQVAMASEKASARLELNMDDVKLWSPDQPHLYDLRVKVLNKEQKEVDAIKSYFGMRKVNVERGPNGYNRIFLNNEPLFQIGPLDQGFWPDGLYTAPSDEALKYDIQMTKDMGFNMIRKHVKLEAERWYYWCDKIGILVWQDMPSGDEEAHGSTGEIDKDKAAAQQFETELKEMMDEYHNHPSIVMWVVFNEGWGQYEAARLAKWAKEYDPSRLINSASGWLDMGKEVGDVKDIHKYPGPAMPDPEPFRVAVLGEFGGQALAMTDHMWVQDLEKAPTHFETSKTSAELKTEYMNLYESLYPLIDKGLAAAVYTQTTDVESEVNGLMTYDRKVLKLNIDTLNMVHQKTYRKKDQNTP